MAKKLVWSLMLFLMACNLFLAGCQLQRNLETGKIEWRADPVVMDKVEAGMQGGVGILEILTPFIGPVGGIATGTLATALACFKKLKPQITKYKSKAELSHAVASVSIEAIEIIKKTYPQAWSEAVNKVDKLIVDNDIPTAEIKNAIRGLRGLSPKLDVKTL